MKYKRLGWVGIVRDRPHFEYVTDDYNSMGESIRAVDVYKSKKEAKRRYDAVVEVFIKQ